VQAWDDGIRGEATRALHLLLAWLGAAAPIPEADIRSVSTGRPWTSSRRVLRFLEEHDLVVPDPAHRADGAMARLVVGLVAIHALRNVELVKLRLDDLDLARGRLTVHRGTSRHTVYLDGLTHRLAVAWLRERQRRWPYTSNSYLLVSQQTSPPHYAATPATHADPSPPSGSASDETDVT